MSIDRRIRAGLHESVTWIDPEPRSVLADVQRRARNRHRAHAGLTLTAAALACTTLLLVGHLFMGLRPEVPPSPVVHPPTPAGTYVVDLPSKSWLREANLDGRWLVTLHPDGVMAVTPPPGYDGQDTDASYRVDGDQFRTNVFLDHPGCQATPEPVGVYRWLLRADTLVFSVVRDACPDRRLLFTASNWQLAR